MRRDIGKATKELRPDYARDLTMGIPHAQHRQNPIRRNSWEYLDTTNDHIYR